MSRPLTLLAVFAHPDDESLGVGGTLARYAAEGVDVELVCATRGEKGRYFDNTDRPSDEEVGRTREEELRCAADVLGIRRVSFLDYVDGELGSADPTEAVHRIVEHIHRVRPQVVVTFDPFGVYGHPDHVAISQLTVSAVVAAASPDSGPRPHAVSKVYYSLLDAERARIHQQHFKSLGMEVDGVEREVVEWPKWSITTRISCEDRWRETWSAVRCHRTQMAIFGHLEELDEAEHRALWGTQSFYRVMSRVNGGRALETDLFAGLR
ncbi:MAG: PIG-L family deacetylase [Longimicrobiales bacterium]|nr:PIG-L family deacetylase [Longimicrobiales bacterium]